MAQPRDHVRTRAKRTAPTPAAVSPPEMPPLSREEEEHNREIIDTLNGLARELRQRNLAAAVVLAQQAMGGQGPLVDHFAELGRRFGHLLRIPQKRQPMAERQMLNVIDGGKL